MKHGIIELCYGHHEVAIQLNYQPHEVWTTLHCKNETICCGTISKIGINIIENGFILYADIKCNDAIIKWKTHA